MVRTVPAVLIITRIVIKLELPSRPMPISPQAHNDSRHLQSADDRRRLKLDDVSKANNSKEMERSADEHGHGSEST